MVIADRHPMVLQGLSSLLGAEGDFEVVASCSDAASCVQAIERLAPDIAILDSTMPELIALSSSVLNPADRSIRLAFFMPSEDYDLLLPDALDGCSVVLKETLSEVLVQSLRQIARGERILPQPSIDQATPAGHGVTSDSALAMLTDRERQIMRLVSEGLSNKQIGRRLNIADGTIKVHLHHVFQKLEISNRTALAALAISQNDRGTPVKSTESE
ncbi:LuxR C-terminal-related transcriptional regulator [Bradyrhizobium arachidis]|uniref:LuxR C-terminal-related transcriptional regulator n=1 Tax=Bradyrhizobium arachidis TaxID=858423 RepID=UPI001FCD3653|nr:response regulator transcription factor [Bradyrhizobium arachidis]